LLQESRSFIVISTGEEILVKLQIRRLHAGLIKDLSRDGIRPTSGAQFGQWHVQGGVCPCTRNSENISLRSTIGHYRSSGSCAGYRTHGTV